MPAIRVANLDKEIVCHCFQQRCLIPKDFSFDLFLHALPELFPPPDRERVHRVSICRRQPSDQLPHQNTNKPIKNH